MNKIYMYCEQYYPTVTLTHRPNLFCTFFGGLECVDHSFAYVAQLFLRDVWIRTQWTAVASMRATNLATHLPRTVAAHLSLSHPSPSLATHLST